MDKGQIQGRKETTSKALSYSLEERRCNLWAKNEKRCFRSQQCTKMELFFFFVLVCLFYGASQNEADAISPHRGALHVRSALNVCRKRKAPSQQ